MIAAFGVAATFVVAAFLWGLNHGINIGVEETTDFYLRQSVPVPCAPTLPLELPAG